MEAETRARMEREVRVTRDREIAAARERAMQREEAWRDSGREREPPAVAVRYPIVETRTFGRFGAIGGKAHHLEWFGGALASRVFPFAPWLGFELGGGIDAVGLSAPRFRWVHVEPAVLTCLEDGAMRACGRGAIDVALPFEGGAAAPSYFVALKVGGELQFFSASLFDGGYASFALTFNLLAAGADGGSDAKRNVAAVGGEASLGVAVAF